jgi:hypothetical protein
MWGHSKKALTGTGSLTLDFIPSRTVTNTFLFFIYYSGLGMFCYRHIDRLGQHTKAVIRILSSESALLLSLLLGSPFLAWNSHVLLLVAWNLPCSSCFGTPVPCSMSCNALLSSQQWIPTHPSNQWIHVTSLKPPLTCHGHSWSLPRDLKDLVWLPSPRHTPSHGARDHSWWP